VILMCQEARFRALEAIPAPAMPASLQPAAGCEQTARGQPETVASRLRR